MSRGQEILKAALASGEPVDAEALARQLAEAAASEAAPDAAPADPPEVAAALERAALVGVFDPAAIAADVAADAPAVTSALIHRSHPAPGRPGLRILNVEDRRTRIAALQDGGRLKAAMATTPLAPDDGLGAQLRGRLDGRVSAPVDPAAPPDPATLGALRDDLRVSAWLGDEDPLRRLARRAAVAQAATDARIAQVAARFVGRGELLDNLTAALFDPEARARAAASAGLPVIVTLHGLGGVGKSAVMSKLRDRLGRDRPDLLFVRIDFDRPGFDTADAAYLTDEFARQLARQIGDPDLLAGVWSGPQDPATRRPLTKTASYEQRIFSQDAAVSALARLSAAAGLGARPVLMFLDTFEMRQGAGQRVVAQTFEWLRRLVAADGGLGRLSVLIAGRAPVNADDLPPTLNVTYPLGDLPRDEAVALLEMLGHPRGDAEALAQVGGNPLLLHLVSRRVFAADGLTVAEVVDLADTGGIDDAELRQGIVYNRILNHVRDPVLRELSYPGLALREFSPGLIRAVLAPACLGRDIDDMQARKLFEALRSEVWLVEEAGPDLVSHRRDVRRMMLPWLVRDPAVAPKAALVHRLAIDYHMRNGNPEEAAYHRTMTADPVALADGLDATGARDLLRIVGQDADCLPRAVAVTLRVLTDEIPREADFALLPPRLWDLATDRHGPVLADREDFALALKIHADRPAGAGAVPRLWHRRAEDATAAWDTPAAAAFLDWLDEGPGDALRRVEQAALTALRLDRPTTAVAAALAAAVEPPSAGVAADLPGDDLRRLEGWRRLLSDWGSLSTALTAEDRTHVARLAIYGGIALRQLRGMRLADAAFAQMAPSVRHRIWDGAPLARHVSALEPQLPLVEELRRLILLGLIEGEAAPLPVTDTVFIPAISWLDAVGADLQLRAPEAAAAWTGFAADVRDGTQGIGPLTNALPFQAADILNGAVLSGVPLDGPLYDALAFPEHRAPLRGALLDLLRADREGGHGPDFAALVEMLAALCAGAGTIWPANLSPAAAALVPAGDLERELARVIHFADQAGLVVALAGAAAAHWPDSAALARVAGDVSAWEAAFRGARDRRAA